MSPGAYDAGRSFREVIVQLSLNPTCVLVQMEATTLSEAPVYRRMRRHSVGDVALAQIASVPQTVVARLDEVPATALEGVQLQLVLSGSLILDQGGEQTEYTAGDIAVYDVSRPFSFHYPDEFATTIVQVPAVTLDGTVGRSPSRAGADSIGRRLLVAELRSAATADPDRMIAAARLIAAEQRGASVSSGTGTGTGASAGVTAGSGTGIREYRVPPGHLVDLVSEHIAAHYSDPRLSSASIAARFHVSLRTLFAAFEHADSSLGGSIRRRRVEVAAGLLATTGLTVAEVATAVGYSDTTAFIRVWRAATGSTPGRWRRHGGH